VFAERIMRYFAVLWMRILRYHGKRRWRFGGDKFTLASHLSSCR